MIANPRENQWVLVENQEAQIKFYWQLVYPKDTFRRFNDNNNNNNNNNNNDNTNEFEESLFYKVPKSDGKLHIYNDSKPFLVFKEAGVIFTMIQRSGCLPT